MKLSMIIPTRDRPEVLRETLVRLELLDPIDLGACELLIIDNASSQPLDLPGHLANGIEVRGIRLETNIHAAARNIGAEEAVGDWLIMLDDDSSPLSCPIVEILSDLPSDVAAVGGEIRLPNSKRESGGLPEVIVGCGCAIRRDSFLAVGCYDELFGYYAEEYDLCAKLIRAGHRVLQTRSLMFEHRKSTVGRDFNEIIYRLVRNNAWVYQRYAPEYLRRDMIDSMVNRYHEIAIKEAALIGFERGLAELKETLDLQVRSPLDPLHWDRFTGRAAVRAGIGTIFHERGEPVQLVGPRTAKGREIVQSELLRQGCSIERSGDAVSVVTSISPGPMLDLHEQSRAIMPWFFGAIGQAHDPLHTIS